MMPSSTEMYYFIEIAQAGVLSRAAERLGITQPSLSLALKRLEKTMGVQLFIRHKQGVTLTQAGKQLLVHARQLLHYWENTKTKALASEREVQGHFSIGCHTTLGIYALPQFLPKLLERYPKLSINLKHGLSRKITEEVVRLNTDIGIVVNPFKHPDLIIRKLFEDEVTFWVQSGKKGVIQNLNSTDAAVVCDLELTQTQTLLKRIKKLNISTHRIITTVSLEVVASLTAHGAGIGILPERVVKALYPKKLCRIPHAPVYKDEICLVYRHENRHIQAVQTIIQAISKSHYS